MIQPIINFAMQAILWIRKEKSCYLLHLIAALIAFGIGYLHHRWFFPLHFHGDAASMQVLAKAILDEGSLLPADFAYGNQLIFFRSSPFIALALMAGLTGYKAFIIGSSLSIAFWGVVLHLFLSTYFRSRTEALLFLVLLLIPIGYWDLDYVLGQQSHLSNVVLSLGVVIFLGRYIYEGNRFFLFTGCVCLFVMSSESPIRGLLVLAPALVATALTATPRIFILISLGTVSSFLLAFWVNKILIGFRPVELILSNTITFKPSNEIINNLLSNTGEMLGSVSSLNTVAGAHLSGLGFLIFAGGILVVIGYFYFILEGALKTTRLAMEKFAHPIHSKGLSVDDNGRFVSLTAVLGVIFGAFAVAALNPDTARHYLWSIVVVKLCLFIGLYGAASRLTSKVVAGIFVVSTSLVLSSWFAVMVSSNWNTKTAINNRNYSEAVLQIKRIVNETGITNIYGEDFWRMMPLNSTLHNVNAQSLQLIGSEIYPYYWLTRPSWSCVEGDVLYFLKDGPVDRVIEGRLKALGGSNVHGGNGYSLWIGPRIWKNRLASSCVVSAL